MVAKFLIATVALVCVSSSLVMADSSTTAPEVDFTGEYTLQNSDNFNEFLKEIGMGYFKRLAATASSSRYVISRNKDTGAYTLKTISTFKDSEFTFKDGEQFKEDRADGATVDTTINIRGNKWEQTQKSDPPVNVVREFKANGELTVTSTANGVTSVRTYKKQ